MTWATAIVACGRRGAILVLHLRTVDDTDGKHKYPLCYATIISRGGYVLLGPDAVVERRITRLEPWWKHCLARLRRSASLPLVLHIAYLHALPKRASGAVY